MSHASTPRPSAAIAKKVLEVVPALMRLIRREMRAHGEGLSVPQFRTLLFVDRNPRCSLAAAAEHLGVTPATASATVERLVRQALIERSPAPTERRRVQLALTETGRALVREARQGTQARLAQRLSGLTAAELDVIGAALELLRTAVDEPAPASAAAPKTEAPRRSPTTTREGA